MGANPVENLVRATGDWTMRFLILSLCISPLYHAMKWKNLNPYRKAFGLLALFYGFIHMLVYIGLDYLFNFSLIFDDISASPFILIGAGSLVLIIAAGTRSVNFRPGGSPPGAGDRNWRVLSWLVYLSSLGGSAHYLLKLKFIKLEPVIYSSLVIILLSYRLFIYVWGLMSNQLGHKKNTYPETISVK
jgi:sulfoxide reductase heme-binding subunit YedZ